MSRTDPGVEDCVILIGGEGRRLGRRKESVEIGGETLLDRHLERWKALFPRLWVSRREISEDGGEGGSHPPHVIVDPPGSEGVIDVIAGILEQTGAPTMVIAVDLPLLPVSLVERLIQLHRRGTSVIPRNNLRLEPLAAGYDPSAIDGIATLIDNGCRSLQQLPSACSCSLPRWPQDLEKWAGGVADPFFNLNTPEDLKQLDELER